PRRRDARRTRARRGSWREVLQRGVERIDGVEHRFGERTIAPLRRVPGDPVAALLRAPGPQQLLQALHIRDQLLVAAKHRALVPGRESLSRPLECPARPLEVLRELLRERARLRFDRTQRLLK